MLEEFYQKISSFALGGHVATLVAGAHRQESLYQGIDDTIVQLFISQASVLMTRVGRIQSESHNQEQEKEHENSDGAHIARRTSIDAGIGSPSVRVMPAKMMQVRLGR